MTLFGGSLFSQEEMEVFTKVDTVGTYDGPRCLDCGLFKLVCSPKTPWKGEGRLETLIIGKSPDQEEDASDSRLISKADSLLQEKLKRHGLVLDKDFWKIHAVNCRTWEESKSGKRDRTPTKEEVAYCRPMVIEAIEELKPKNIVLLGGTACRSILGENFKRVDINRWRGLKIPDQRFNAWIFPIYHPSFPAKDTKNQNIMSVFDRDLKDVIYRLETKHPPKLEEEKLHCLTNIHDITDLLDYFIETAPEVFYFDYEATGIKPYHRGHKLVSMSLSVYPGEAYAFPYQYQDFFTSKEQEAIRSRWVKIMQNPKIGKAAHNKKMEHTWTKMILGVDVINWDWDSLLAAHVLDNRRGWSGLKFQIYINFGFLPYNNQIAPYITGSPFNRMDSAPLDILLPYGARDSLYGLKLMMDQWEQYEENKESGGKLREALQLLEEGHDEFANIEMEGIPVDEEYYHKKNIEIKEGLEQLEQRILNGEEATEFYRLKGRQIKIAKEISPEDLRFILFDIIKIKSDKETTTGLMSTDAEVLQRTNHPFTKAVLERRKLLKVKSYPEQFIRATVDGKMHPSFNTIIPVTYRSSSEDPNFHNIPNRDKEAQQLTRGGIIPSPGYQIAESDFSGIEVGTSTAYNHDANLIAYVKDATKDMHRDSAMKIWKLSQREITRNIRHSGKNGWVFPEFYGSWYKECAKALWLDYLSEKTSSGITLRDHLYSQGITTLAEFEQHCQTVERLFWDVMFPQYRDWKIRINQEYIEKGYLETFFGFVFRGLMGRNDTTNYQTQGTAFHILLWTLIQISRKIREERKKSRIIGQIHDSMVFNIYPPERDWLISTVDYFGCTRTAQEFPWLRVPFKIEHKIAPIDRPWSECVVYQLP